MKLPFILFIGLTTFLSACSTLPKENYQQDYERDLTNGDVMMMTLRAMDTDDISKARRVAMTDVHMILDELSYLDVHANPTSEQKQNEIKLARTVLDYMLAHREDFDMRLPSVQAGVRGLRKILTDSDDVRQLAKLAD